MSSVKQMQINRKTLRHGGRGEPEPELLATPTTSASDTSAAAAVLDRIDAALAA